MNNARGAVRMLERRDWEAHRDWMTSREDATARWFDTTGQSKAVLMSYDGLVAELQARDLMPLIPDFPLPIPT